MLLKNVLRVVLAASLVSITPSLVHAQQDSLLDVLAKEDQAYRLGRKVMRDDRERGRIVLERLAAGAVRTPEDRFNAAIILQHSPLTIRDGEIAAVNPEHYLLAHLLAARAYDDGYIEARYLVAQSLDRYLTFTTGMQRYGTNRLVNQTTGVEELVYVDRRTSDAERARFGVAPLATLLKKHPERAAPSIRE